jgi:hypothetical protein
MMMVVGAALAVMLLPKVGGSCLCLWRPQLNKLCLSPVIA